MRVLKQIFMNKVVSLENRACLSSLLVWRKFLMQMIKFFTGLRPIFLEQAFSGTSNKIIIEPVNLGPGK